MSPSRPFRARRRAVAILAVALLASACGSPSPTAVPSSPAIEAPSTPPPSVGTPAPSSSAGAPGGDALYTRIEGQVVAERGLQPKTAVARKVVDAAGMTALVTTSFRSDNPDTLVAATDTLYKTLLLVPATASVASLWTDLLSSQVIGLYDDKSKTMYVLSTTGTIGPAEQITYAHEYTHALQDQAFNLESVVGTAKDESDRQLARLMLVEGDATLSMSLWARANLTPAELATAAGASDPASQAVLDRTPAILKEPLLAEYSDGLTLCVRAYAGGGYAAVDALFAHPPDSTEQVLHADKLAAREAPVAVTFPSDLATRLGAGWTVPMQDTFGELQLDILLRDAGGVDATTATAAAAGWGGDRVALLEGPGGAVGVVLDTAWDTAKDADEFATALGGLVTKLQAAGRGALVERTAAGHVVLLVGDSDTTATTLQGAMFGVGG